MPIFAIPYPMIDPVLVDIGPFPIRWYALAYVAGLVAGWATARYLVGRDKFWAAGQPRPSVLSIDDLVVYIAVGIILGGRTGYVLFYNLPFFLAHPVEIPKLWTGGMAFHGGLVGAVLGLWIFARRNKIPMLTVADVVAAGVPFGLLFGRLANFIKPELWGRETDVPWAMVFPGAGPLPRHPSQLYEAALEGVVLLLILAVVIRRGGLRRHGLVAGLFAAGYGVARITAEFFREPDPQLGFLFGGATMGMLLSVPLILLGLVIVADALRRPAFGTGEVPPAIGKGMP
ncbi:prolipoprotein diacylglyceryl transferase [Lichenifustis flavocetrariae]|uniref:Phosphatidylglycerol--prolipoprotein diacylglyceryl transferase n=1 Tax=Lichenifustis flavocetrariae TaxID=2949735 RepID=A0AA41YVX1_9HYPH|nr:prolipoprotein diacylglyceryl transferase [Lichenifustis flavocetrariae]MCW6508122.1 prolipoprotein diacylglyceryl transferase [Lichenifustis flavocetrariae]